MTLSGTAPFFADSQAALLKKVQRGKFEMAGKTWETVSEGAKALVCALMMLDEDARLTAARALGLVSNGDMLISPQTKRTIGRSLGCMNALPMLAKLFSRGIN